jgi:MtN3 and saliva related transmembrane protein
MNIAIIGLIAGFFTTWGLVPQIYKSWRTKKTKDISLLMYIIIGIGALLWITYGFLISDFPIIFWNITAFVFILTIISLKMKYD